MNRSGRAPTVISPRRGCSPMRARSAEVRVGQRRRSRARSPSARSYNSRGGSVRSRSRMPRRKRIRRDPAERHRSRATGQDPLDLAQPVRCHLGDMGEYLGWSPVRLVGVIEDRRQRPWRTRFDGGAGGLESGDRGIEAGEQVVHGGQCGTSGVAWEPTAGETRDGADHLAWRRQSGGRPHRRGRLRQGRRLPAAQRHRPRRVLGRQRSAGRRLLPGVVGLHAGRLQRSRDQGPGPGELRHGPARHPVRVHCAAHPGR